MIDFENQRFITGRGKFNIPSDNIGGYTIQPIEEGLKNAKFWAQWRNNRGNRRKNPTSG